MKIKKRDVERLRDTARAVSNWLDSIGRASAANRFDKSWSLLGGAKPHRRDKSSLAIRHSVIRKVQKHWFAGLMEFYRYAAVPVSELNGDLLKVQALIKSVTEGYQFIEWFVIDSLNKDNLDEEDHREADEAFAEEERLYRAGQGR